MGRRRGSFVVSRWPQSRLSSRTRPDAALTASDLQRRFEAHDRHPRTVGESPPWQCMATEHCQGGWSGSTFLELPRSGGR
jgi:hypothetical protein